MTSCFVYKVIRDLESIDHLFINPIHRTGLIHKQSFDSRLVKWSVQDNVLFNNCKQNITSVSLLLARQLCDGVTYLILGKPHYSYLVGLLPYLE